MLARDADESSSDMRFGRHLGQLRRVFLLNSEDFSVTEIGIIVQRTRGDDCSIDQFDIADQPAACAVSQRAECDGDNIVRFHALRRPAGAGQSSQRGGFQYPLNRLAVFVFNF